jgi:hypothetical protein
MYEFDKAKFLMENFDGEAVLVNVASGYYYSLLGSGPDILDLLGRGLSVEKVAETFAAGAPDPTKIHELVAAFADQLLEESILIPRQSSSANAPETEASGGGVAVAFAPPELTKFEDMRDILLLDPIHQVDEAAGWPKPR